MCVFTFTPIFLSRCAGILSFVILSYLLSLIFSIFLVFSVCVYVCMFLELAAVTKFFPSLGLPVFQIIMQMIFYTDFPK